MTERGRQFGGEHRRLRDAFRELKQRGPQILVTGDVPEAVSRRATQRLLGHPAEHRHRILTLTDSAAETDEWLPGSVSGTDRGVAVIRDGALRATATSQPSDGADHAMNTTRDVGTGENTEATATSDDIAARVSSEVTGWLDGRDDPGPAVLRVGIYSLETLLEQRGIDAVRAFCYQLTGEVRRARGMGHYHLPRAADSEAVSELRYVFDARLELRDSGAGAEQRWHIPGTGTTGWVSLDAEP